MTFPSRLIRRCLSNTVSRSYATIARTPAAEDVPYISRYDTKRLTIYQTMEDNLAIMRRRLKRALTLSEKILYGHLHNPHDADIRRGSSYIHLRPDRVFSHDCTAQMVLLQFMTAGLSRTAIPMTVHCDHLVRARSGAADDLARCLEEDAEIYEFLTSATAKYGIGFWKAGSGILHSIIFENYAFPGGLILGTDSHTPNTGGLGMLGVGVGGADAVDVMADMPWEVTCPNVIGVKLSGKLGGWASPKDVILKLAGMLTVKGGTGAIVEYYGEGVDTLSSTGMATICNMGAEIGATSSIFPFTSRMADYLHATNRGAIAEHAKKYSHILERDEGAEYDQVLEIDLSDLEPHINGPYTPDLSTPISKFAAEVKKNSWPQELKVALIGSCTNSSYQDMMRCASVAREANQQGIHLKTALTITPGSEQIRATIARDGIIQTLEQAGGLVLANACGPCIGQWDRQDVAKGEKNSIISSFNRNFSGRNDSNPGTHAFVSSPEIAIAMAFAGDLTFNPVTDFLKDSYGKAFKFSDPSAVELPPKGYTPGEDGYRAAPPDGSAIQVAVRPDSDRLQLLVPFQAWNGQDPKDMPILIKVDGKCTTDQTAGPWLKYRGHLENISQNCLIGAINEVNGQANNVENLLTGEWGAVPTVASDYKRRGRPWVVVGSWNYGEGSSREHAALEPRFLGGIAVIARSFARIMESNLKKQGMLPLVFKRAEDYELVQSTDFVDLLGIEELMPGSTVTMRLHHKDGTSHDIPLSHSYNAMQIRWFQRGSALNLMGDLANTATEVSCT